MAAFHNSSPQLAQLQFEMAAKCNGSMGAINELLPAALGVIIRKTTSGAAPSDDIPNTRDHKKSCRFVIEFYSFQTSKLSKTPSSASEIV